MQNSLPPKQEYQQKKQQTLYANQTVTLPKPSSYSNRNAAPELFR
jgi:hypothetical protein